MPEQEFTGGEANLSNYPRQHPLIHNETTGQHFDPIEGYFYQYTALFTRPTTIDIGLVQALPLSFGILRSYLAATDPNFSFMYAFGGLHSLIQKYGETGYITNLFDYTTVVEEMRAVLQSRGSGNRDDHFPRPPNNPPRAARAN